MVAVAALLAVAVAASPSTPPRRTGLDVSNSARARMGLLPRKPARRADVRDRRLLTIRAPAPTYLAEPAPLAEDAPDADVEPVAGAEAAPGDGGVADPGAERVAARGPVEAVTLPSTDAPADPADAPPAVAPPEELGAIRFAAVGVETEVTLRMRFDP